MSPAPVDTLRTVETPEGVELGLRVAGPAVRAAAYVLDQLLRVILYGMVGTPLSYLGEVGQGLLLIFIFLTEFFYPVAFEVLNNGATPGKAAFAITVVYDDGTPVDFSASLVRNLLRAADFLPLFYLFGLVSTLVHPDFKRLGDLAADTLVVHRDLDRPASRDADVAPIPVPLSLSLSEQRAIVEYAERTDTWTEDRAQELAELLSPLIGARGQDAVRRLLGMASWLRGRR